MVKAAKQWHHQRDGPVVCCLHCGIKKPPIADGKGGLDGEKVAGIAEGSDQKSGAVVPVLLLPLRRFLNLRL